VAGSSSIEEEAFEFWLTMTSVVPPRWVMRTSTCSDRVLDACHVMNVSNWPKKTKRDNTIGIIDNNLSKRQVTSL
jgi:hypothetical protein